jgi:hypothetical protein
MNSTVRWVKERGTEETGWHAEGFWGLVKVGRLAAPANRYVPVLEVELRRKAARKGGKHPTVCRCGRAWSMPDEGMAYYLRHHFENIKAAHRRATPIIPRHQKLTMSCWYNQRGVCRPVTGRAVHIARPMEGRC